MIEIAPSQVYTIRDVAEYLKCSTRKVHRLVANGELRGFKIGNQRRFKGEEVLQFIERQGGGESADPSLVAAAVQPDRLYSLRETAAILRVSSADVAHMLRTGKLAGFRVGMDWRCWGRELLRLTEYPEGAEIPAEEIPEPEPEKLTAARASSVPVIPVRSAEDEEPIEKAA